jgi:hypothetical protein
MSRVYLDAEKNQWVHADTGNRIDAWQVRNQEPHRSELEKRGAITGKLYSRNATRIAGDVSEPGTVGPNPGEVPIPPTNSAAEEEYIEEILSEANYV